MFDAKDKSHDLPIAVIGAGPVGLAAAAHLLARGLRPAIFEKSKQVAANMRDYGHVRLFSPWRFNIDRAARALLEQAHWRAPDLDALPTGGEIFRDYLAPLAAIPAIAERLRLDSEVTSISRRGFDKVKSAGRDAAPFVMRLRQGNGEEREFLARAVIDASGTWAKPNPLGANGMPAIGERRFAAKIRYGIPDILGVERTRYAGKKVLVVGAGHSAANALLDLAELAESSPQTRIAWAIRGDDVAKTFGGGGDDALAARGALGDALRVLYESGALEVRSGFRVHALRANLGGISVVGDDGMTIDGVDEIVCATGQRPDLDLTRELRLELDPWLECAKTIGPLIDPNLHSCGTVRPHGARELAHPETGFYTVGVKSYGRAPTFLLATGYEQVRSVAAALAGDMKAASEVHLELPKTGVCTTQPRARIEPAPAAACCSPARRKSPGETSRSSPEHAKPAEAACCSPPS
jgi:hypothetical protein